MTQAKPDPHTVTIPSDEPRLHFHIRGLFGDDGENEGVLSVVAVLDASEHYPAQGRIIVGSPPASPLLDGHLPSLGGFCCGIEGAERLIWALQNAVRAVREALPQQARILEARNNR